MNDFFETKKKSIPNMERRKKLRILTLYDNKKF